MDEAEYCHRLALMYRGRVIALGAPAELKEQLEDRQLLYLETPDLLAAINALQDLGEVAVFGAGLHVAVPDADAAEPRIRERVDVRRLERITPSMEDVFVALIERAEAAP
jgi:ABC-2 type transport system ATP-binding protein